MKKNLLILLLIIFIIPSTVLASWWNPFSWNIWNIFKASPKEKVEVVIPVSIIPTIGKNQELNEKKYPQKDIKENVVLPTLVQEKIKDVCSNIEGIQSKIPNGKLFYKNTNECLTLDEIKTKENEEILLGTSKSNKEETPVVIQVPAPTPIKSVTSSSAGGGGGGSNMGSAGGGGGGPFTALVDPTMPRPISDIQVINITENSVTITWVTKEMANGKVFYSTSPSFTLRVDCSSGYSSMTGEPCETGISPSSSSVAMEVVDSTKRLNHSLNLNNLIGGTIYYFEVSSVWTNGSVSSTDHSFTTLK